MVVGGNDTSPLPAVGSGVGMTSSGMIGDKFDTESSAVGLDVGTTLFEDGDMVRSVFCMVGGKVG